MAKLRGGRTVLAGRLMGVEQNAEGQNGGEASQPGDGAGVERGDAAGGGEPEIEFREEGETGKYSGHDGHDDEGDQTDFHAMNIGYGNVTIKLRLCYDFKNTAVECAFLAVLQAISGGLGGEEPEKSEAQNRRN